MDPPPPRPSSSPENATAGVPLRLVHIFVWTALSALFLVVQRWTFDLGEYDAVSDSVFVIVDGAECMIYGAAIGALLLFAWRWLHHGQPPLHPGHWLLAAMGIVVLARNGSWVLMERLLARLPDGSFHHFPSAAFFLHSLEGGVAAVLFLLVALLVRGPTAWRWFFALMATAAALRCWAYLAHLLPLGVFGLFDNFWYLHAPSAVLALAALGVAVGMDVVRQRRRDVFHWAGVACCVAESFLYWVLEVYFRYIFPTLVEPDTAVGL